MIKLKDLMKVIPSNKVIEITYIRKGRPNIIEMAVAEDVKFRNQYIVEKVDSSLAFETILKIQVRERHKRWV